MEKIKDINVLDIIITFVQAIKDTPKKKNEFYHYFDDKENRIWSVKYLLGQILRQYRVDDKHILVSKRANELWEKITNEESIRNHGYRDVIQSKVDMKIIKYSGASKSGVDSELKKGGNFIWNDIFHDEHVIPIDTIIKRLVNEPELNYEKTKKILDDIVICKMLKEENNVLDSKGYRVKRKETVRQTIEEIYFKECGIEIANWE